MKRSTFSIVLAAAILAIGAFALWFFLIAPRLGVAPLPWMRRPVTGSATETPATAEKARNSVLNLYLASSPNLPDGAIRAELTLTKATLTSADGKSSVVFEGAQRVMMQSGIVEKVLSEKILDARWTRLTLEFSPAAELAYANGNVKAALLEKKTAVFTFDATVGVSRSLALYAIVPLERNVTAADKAIIARVDAAARPADTYVFGGFLFDPRGRGDLFTLNQPSLFAVIKEDLGFDLSVVKPGSKGFTPAAASPTPQAPR